MGGMKDTITIPTCEYIDLLRCKAASLVASIKADAAVTTKAKTPRCWTTTAEKAEIIRLHRLGYRIVEISKVVGRTRGTVRGVIQKHGLS